MTRLRLIALCSDATEIKVPRNNRKISLQRQWIIYTPSLSTKYTSANTYIDKFERKRNKRLVFFSRVYRHRRRRRRRYRFNRAPRRTSINFSFRDLAARKRPKRARPARAPASLPCDKETRYHLRKYQAKELNRASTTPSGGGHIKATLGDYRSARNGNRKRLPLFVPSVIDDRPPRARHARNMHTRAEAQQTRTIGTRRLFCPAPVAPPFLPSAWPDFALYTLTSSATAVSFYLVRRRRLVSHGPCTLSHPPDILFPPWRMHMHIRSSPRSLRLVRVELAPPISHGDERRSCAYPRTQVRASLFSMNTRS